MCGEAGINAVGGFATCDLVAYGQEVVGEVRTAFAVSVQGAECDLFVFNGELGGDQNLLQYSEHLGLAVSVGPAQNLDQFAQHDLGDAARLGAAAHFLNQSVGLGGLLGFVLGDVAHQNVGVEADHGSIGSLLPVMVSAISSIETGRGEDGRAGLWGG